MADSNQRILDAAVIAWHAHYTNRDRPLRVLVATDFDRIRSLRADLQAKWRTEKARSKHLGDEKTDYNEWRKAHLRRLAREHRWHESTLNLYASIHSTLINWDRYGLTDEHKRILAETRAGVRLWAQFLPECGDVLL